MERRRAEQLARVALVLLPEFFPSPTQLPANLVSIFFLLRFRGETLLKRHGPP